MSDEPTITVTSLRFATATLLVLGGLTLAATLILTETPDALITGVCWAVFCFALPATGAWVAAYWLEMRAVHPSAGILEER